jgi:predicted GNAT family acetyltransferase
LRRSAIIQTVSFVVTRDPDAFAHRVWSFIEPRIECNVLATVLMRARDGVYVETPPLFAYSADKDGKVRAAVGRMPPYPLLSSSLSEDDAHELLRAWLEHDPSLPGATGPPATVRALSRAWTRRAGGSTRVRLREAMQVLEQVDDPPRAAQGLLRTARQEEAALLAQWLRAFADEAGVTGGNESARTMHSRIARGGIFIWDDDGPVSLVGANPPVAGVVRIGPVYTPPERRRRGYAGHAVAAVSRRAMRAGANRCMLFTDLANPTSNKIYAEVGFRVFGDWEEHEFLADGRAL